MSRLLWSVEEYVVPGQHVREYPGATRDGRPHTLSLSVKKYIPKETASRSKRVFTILAAGGNGFPKELYEPLWDDLLVQARTSRHFDVNAIWIADMAHQGRSGILNKALLGDDPSWMDTARDLLQVVNHFRDEITTPIIGIGHSIGATALINLALFHPRLLSHLVLIEPILGDCTYEGAFFAHHATRKPDSWRTWREAETYVRSSSPYDAWDPRVVECWLDHGLLIRPDSTNTVELTTSKDQEAVTYVRPLPKITTREQDAIPDFVKGVDEGRNFYCPAATLTMSRLNALRMNALYVFGEKSVMTPLPKREAILSSTGVSLDGDESTTVITADSKLLQHNGHLVPFESPKQCAAAIAESFSQSPGRETPIDPSFDYPSMRVSEDWKSSVKREVSELKLKRLNRL